MADSQRRFRRLLVQLAPQTTFFERLASFLLFAQEEGGEEEPSKSKGPPPHWKEFMDAVYSGGKKKVPNTDSKTKNRFKQVSVSTLFKKDQAFRKKVMKEYQAWVEKNKKDKGGVKKKPGEEKTTAPAKGKVIKGVDPKRIAKLAKEIKSYISSFSEEDAEDMVSELSEEVSRVPEAEKLIDGLSNTQLHLTHILTDRKVRSKIESFFTKSVETKAGVDAVKAFVDTVISPGSRKMMGALDALGVSGSVPDYEKDDERVRENRQEGKDNEVLRKSVVAMYERTQAVLQALGIKELKVYRGMTSINSEDIKENDPIKVRSREAASTTLSPVVAGKFGRIVEYTVPASQIFALPNLMGATEYDEEVEAMVMGLDDTVGSVRSGPRKASTSDWQAQVAQEDYEKKKQVAASKKKAPKVVSPTKEDDDFLREMRKKKGKPPKKK